MLLHQNIKAFRSHFLPSGQHVYLAEAWRFVKVVLNAKCQAYFKNQFGRVNSCHRVSPNCLENRMFPSFAKHLRYSFLRELGRVCGMCCTLVVEGWHHAPGTSAVSFDRFRRFRLIDLKVEAFRHGVEDVNYLRVQVCNDFFRQVDVCCHRDVKFGRKMMTNIPRWEDVNYYHCYGLQWCDGEIFTK